VPQVEELVEGEPEAVVIENARRKAVAGMETAASGERDIVLGVDTEVVLDGRLLGKASNESEARDRLAVLSGRTHDVLSGVAALRGDANERSGVERSQVTFRELSSGLIDAYLASGEWRDRAGAYAVQGLGSMLVQRVDGDLSNVIGLPVDLLLELVPDLLDTAGDSPLPSGF
jgi:septum formation protein